MKSFDEMLTRMQKENYTTFMNKLVVEKVPIACFIPEPTTENMKFYSELLDNGFNLTALITSPVDILALTHSPQIFKCILVKDKLAASFLRRPELKDIPIIILSKNKNKIRLIYDTYLEHLNDLAEVYSQLGDELSKKTFLGFLLAKVTRNINYAVFANTSQYICEEFLPVSGSVVIDGGACEGSTSVKFTDMGCNVYAFEMDRENFKLAEKIAKEKKFIVENLGLGSYKHKILYTHNVKHIGITRESEFGTETADIITLDEYVSNHKISKVDFIKLDTEGAELDILKGAQNVIYDKKPILAVSVYHKPEHIWEIAKYLKFIRPDHNFALRHYLVSSEDVPFVFDESLKNYLMFIPDSKLISFGECVLFAK